MSPFRGKLQRGYVARVRILVVDGTRFVGKHIVQLPWKPTTTCGSPPGVARHGR